MTPALRDALRGKQTEGIARLEQPRAIGPLRRPPRIVHTGTGWRLGAIIVSDDGTLYASGTVIRTESERQHGYPSRLAEERAELKAAARRGGIRPGVTLNVDPEPLSLEHPSGPIRSRDGVIEVQWAPGAWSPLEPYLLERAALLPDAE